MSHKISIQEYITTRVSETHLMSPLAQLSFAKFLYTTYCYYAAILSSGIRVPGSLWQYETDLFYINLYRVLYVYIITNLYDAIRCEVK